MEGPVIKFFVDEGLLEFYPRLWNEVQAAYETRTTK
jgi:hypothetical protein